MFPQLNVSLAGAALVMTPEAAGVQSDALFVRASMREIDCVVPQRSRSPVPPK